MSLAKKLDMDVTEDMFKGQSNEDAANAIIGAALESGKTQADIDALLGGGATPVPEASTPAESAAQTEDATTSETE